MAYEILAGAGKPLAIAEIAATGAERLLMPDAFVRDAAALRRRARRGQPAARGRRAEAALPARRRTSSRSSRSPSRASAPPRRPRRAPRSALAAGAGELRRTALAALRRRLRECDGPTVEHVALRLLEKLGFSDLKVAKRGREHVVCTGKRRMGLGEVRHAIRIVRSGADAGRRDVSDLRRDLGHYGAQIGVVLTPGDAAREARSEAAAAGQLPVVLLCGEALAEALADAGVGCVPVVVPEVDERLLPRRGRDRGARGGGTARAPRGAGPPRGTRAARRERGREATRAA